MSGRGRRRPWRPFSDARCACLMRLGRKEPGPEKRSSRGPRSRVPGRPTRTTGVPNKYVGRAAGRPRRQSAQTSRNSLPTGRARTYRGPQQVLPGSPTSATGAPDKNYRGPQQMLPGCPTSTTGVPDKNYRGPQQASLFKTAAKRAFPCRVSGSLCFCFSCSVMLFNNNYRENGEVYPWGQIASN